MKVDCVYCVSASFMYTEIRQLNARHIPASITRNSQHDLEHNGELHPFLGLASNFVNLF